MVNKEIKNIITISVYTNGYVLPKNQSELKDPDSKFDMEIYLSEYEIGYDTLHNYILDILLKHYNLNQFKYITHYNFQIASYDDNDVIAIMFRTDETYKEWLVLYRKTKIKNIINTINN